MKRTLILMFATLLLTGSAAERSASPAAADWQPVNGPAGGSVSALALSPNYAYDRTLYAGVRGKGVYRTIDGGFSWQATGSGAWVVIDVAISPAFAVDQTVFAATGFWTTGYTVYRSTDAGATWQAPASVPLGGLQSLTDLVVSPNYAVDHTLYAIGASETYRSTDGGVTFSTAGGWFASRPLMDLAFSPAYVSDHTLFAAAWGEGVYKSIDSGSTWSLTGLTGFVSTLAVSPNYAVDQMLAAINSDDGHIYISNDRGVTWTAGTLTLLGAATHHTLIFSPTFAGDRTLLAATSDDAGAYRSTDGGGTWSPVGWYDPAQPGLGGFIGGSVGALGLAPNTSLDAAAFAGTSTGIYRSNDWGEHWYQDNNGLPRLTIRSIAAAPGDPNTLLAATAFFERTFTYTPDELDGNLHLSTDGGRTWRVVSGRFDQIHQVAFSPDFANDRTAFAASALVAQHGYSGGGLLRSTDGGQNWNELNAIGLAWSVAVSPDFADDDTLWAYASSALGSGLHVSNDGGDTWSLLPGSIHADVIAPSPNYATDQTLYAATFDSGLQRSTDGGQTWTQMLPYATTALAASPAYGASQTVYAGVQEAFGVPGEVYRSTDGGATWQKLITGIPSTLNGSPLLISAIQSASDGSALIGVSYGTPGFEVDGGAVYRSSDGGQTWSLVAGGLDAYTMFSVASTANRRDVDPHESMSIYAGSDGGLWHFGVTQFDQAEPGAWFSGGPRGGRAQALAVSPNFATDGVAFSGEWLAGHVGDQSGLGIFKSSDGGTAWTSSSSGTELTPYPYGSAVHGFAFSPNFVTDRTVFAATWGGLFKSTDAGAAWRPLPRATFGAPGSFASVAVAPSFATSRHVMAGGGWGGLFRSTDGGVNWTANYSVTSALAIAYSPAFATTPMAFAAGWDGVYKTGDGGVTWTRMLTYPVSSLVLSPRFGDDHLLYAGGSALYISSNEGSGWISRTIAPSVTQVSALAISPNFNSDRTLYAGTNAGLYRSTDGGLNWGVVTGYSGVPILSLAISPGWPGHNVMLIGTSRGVERLMDGVGTPAPGMTPLSIQSITVSADESLWLAGAPDHGVYAGTGDGTAWIPIGLQDGSLHYGISDVAVSPNYLSDRTLFAARKSNVSIGGSVYRSIDGGAAWSIVYSTDNVESLAISPQYATDHTIYATGNVARVQRSTNGGDTWGEVGTWPPGALYAARQVALPPNYPADGTIFAGGNQGFWRLPSGATTWQPAASGLISTTNVIAIAVSPNYSTSHALLAAGWIMSNTLHFGMFRSIDGGVNWGAAGVGLPDEELRGVAFSPDFAADQTAYAISASQLYRSIDGGLRWTAIGGLPGWPALTDLRVTRNWVVVATEAGVWRYGTGFRDVLIDGNFEAGSGWDMPTTPHPAGYSDDVVYDGFQSLRLGIDAGSNVYAYSSARQTVTIPISASMAELSLRTYAVSGEASIAAPSSPTAGDAQYILVIDPANGATLETLLWQLSNDQTWQRHQFDLTEYAGQSIVLHFGVYNDGAGGQTALYVDNASLVVIGPLPYKAYLPLVMRASGP